MTKEDDLVDYMDNVRPTAIAARRCMQFDGHQLSICTSSSSSPAPPSIYDLH